MAVAASPRYKLVWCFIGVLLLLQESVEREKLDRKTIHGKELTIAIFCVVVLVFWGLQLKNSKSLSPLVRTFIVCCTRVMCLVPKQKRFLDQLN